LDDVGEGNVFKLLNAIFVDEKYNISEKYLKETSEHFDTLIMKNNFAKEDIRPVANNLAAMYTGNEVTELLTERPSADTKLILANVILFKGKWKDPFKSRLTADAKFKNADKTESTCRMMYKSSFFDYFCDHKACSVQIPYGGNGDMSFMLLLPKEGVPMQEVLDELTPEIVHYYEQNTYETEIRVGLPKFVLEQKMDLKAPLTRNGMGSIFSSEEADLSKMTGGQRKLFVKKATHLGKIEVNEEGTVASGVTVVHTATRSQHPQFILNRPFIFLIHDRTTKNVLFVGKMANFNNVSG